MLVTQVINRVMLDGKKSTAERIVYDALALASEKTGKPALEVLEGAVKTVTPVLEVRSRRVGGATYQVPIEVPPAPGPHARDPLARPVRPRPAREAHGRQAGRRADRRAQLSRAGAYKKKDDIYRMAQANKAFAHYRW